MTAEPQGDEQLRRPDRVIGPDGTRRDGRPTGAWDEPNAPDPDAVNFPTVAPEEEGEAPPTEHAPGADL
jgi:hypothetical protein